MHANHDARVALIAPVMHHHVARRVAHRHNDTGAAIRGRNHASSTSENNTPSRSVAPVAGLHHHATKRQRHNRTTRHRPFALHRTGASARTPMAHSSISSASRIGALSTTRPSHSSPGQLAQIAAEQRAARRTPAPSTTSTCPSFCALHRSTHQRIVLKHLQGLHPDRQTWLCLP